MTKLALFFGFFMTSLFCYGQTATIRGIRMSGSGCGQATAQAIFTDDAKTVSVLFSNYSVEIGKGTSSPDAWILQKDCRIMIDVSTTPGYQYYVEQIDYRGFVAFPISAEAFHRFVKFKPSGAYDIITNGNYFRGPVTQEYLISRKENVQDWQSSCSKDGLQTIDLMSQILIRYRRGFADRTMAQISLDSVDMLNATSLHLAWRRWVKLIESAHFENNHDAKQFFKTNVDFVNEQAVFDVGGNKVRAVTKVQYGVKIVLVTHVLTHGDYDKKKWKE